MLGSVSKITSPTWLDFLPRVGYPGIGVKVEGPAGVGVKGVAGSDAILARHKKRAQT